MAQWSSGKPELSAQRRQAFSGLIGWPGGSTRSGAVESRNSQLSAGGPFRDQIYRPYLSAVVSGAVELWKVETLNQLSAGGPFRDQGL